MPARRTTPSRFGWGRKLTALGYEVFADVLRLKGGDDWERILETAIRDKAAKFLLVATPHGVQKQGVRNEITIATETARRIKDNAFIIPLRLAPFERAASDRARAVYWIFRKAGRWALAAFLRSCRETPIAHGGNKANVELWRGRPA